LKILTIGVAAVGLAVGASALATNIQPAFAYTPNASGQPGLTQVPVTQGAYSGAGWPQLTFPTRYVWRSDAYAGTQVITVSFRVWKYDSVSRTWPLYTSHAVSAQVAPSGVGSWMTGWTIPVAFDSYAVNVQVNWTTLDGTLFGWKVFDYNTATDYQCLTAATCSVLPNASVGAFIYLHPAAPKPVATQQPTAQPQTASSSSVTINLGSEYGSSTSSASSVTIIGGDGDSWFASLYRRAHETTDSPMFDDYAGLLGPIANNGITSQVTDTGSVLAGLRQAANNPGYDPI
jgi:hypothetical protein